MCGIRPRRARPGRPRRAQLDCAHDVGPTLPELTEALPGVETSSEALSTHGMSRESAMPSSGPDGGSS